MAARKPARERYLDDIDRLAENLENNYPGAIEDINSLDAALEDYFDDADIPNFIDDYRKRKVLKVILFKRGGGKNLKRDQESDAATIHPNTSAGRKQFNRDGASETDLSGVDTKDGKRRKATRRIFKEFGTVKGRVVKVRAVKVRIKGKTITRYIDSRGRFAKKKP